MAKKISSNSQRLGGHIEVHISIEPARRKISDAIYAMTHKKRGIQKKVSIFVAGGIAVDKKLEQANKSVVKKARI